MALLCQYFQIINLDKLSIEIELEFLNKNDLINHVQTQLNQGEVKLCRRILKINMVKKDTLFYFIYYLISYFFKEQSIS
jgi:hypothetical protein